LLKCNQKQTPINQLQKKTEPTTEYRNTEVRSTTLHVFHPVVWPACRKSIRTRTNLFAACGARGRNQPNQYSRSADGQKSVYFSRYICARASAFALTHSWNKSAQNLPFLQLKFHYIR